MADLRAEVRPAAAEHGGKSPGTRNRSQAAPSPRQSPKMHSDSHRELPPGWERLHSERGIYYWNKRDGKTTWKFPEDEAREHTKVVESHIYVNVRPGKKEKPSSVAAQSRTKSAGTVIEGERQCVESGSVSNGVGGVGGELQQRKREGYVSEGTAAAGAQLPNGHGGQGSSKTPSPPSQARKERHYENVVLRNGKVHPREPSASPTSRRDAPGREKKRRSGGSLKGRVSDSLSTSSFGSPPVIPERHYNITEVGSPTPPLPERRYTGSDIFMSPPTVPEQCFADSDISMAPPPLPEQHFTDSDVAMASPPSVPERLYESPSPSPPPLPTRCYSFSSSDTDHQGVKNGNLEQRDESRSPAANKQCDDVGRTAEGTPQSQRHPRVVQREVSQMGDEYALVEPAWKKGSKGRSSSLSERTLSDSSPPPPLPERTAESEQECTAAGEQDELRQDPNQPRPQQEREPQQEQIDPRYVDIDHDLMVERNEACHPGNSAQLTNQDPYNDSIAYAVVKLDRLVEEEAGGRRERSSSSPSPLREIPAEPYQVPVSPRSTLTRDMSSFNTYEEIDAPDSNSQDTGSGYFVVNRDVQRRLASMQRGGADSPSIHQLMHSSLAHPRPPGDHSPTPPPLPKRSLDHMDDSDLGGRTVRSPPLRMQPKSKSVDSEVDLNYSHLGDQTVKSPPFSTQPKSKYVDSKGGNSGSQDLEERRVRDFADPMFEPVSYDLPSNSRRLQAMNITLRRPPQSDDSSGYAKLKLSKEALLLRSGVTLRRYRSSVSSLLSQEGSVSTEEDGSTEGEDGGLEPVNKCIKSLKSSLVLKGDPDDNFRMEKAPSGPPNWLKFQRRPHQYEDVAEKRGTLGSSGSKSLSNLDEPDMDWDESEFATPSAPVKKKELAMSASQPNLLRAPDELDTAFPHLERPERVSEEVFYLRKLRLLQHRYEDVDIPQWPEVGGEEGETMGDVNALKSAIRASLMESDQKSPPPGEQRLPKGWQRMTDEAGDFYFWHVPTGRTQYTRPSGEELRRLSLSSLGQTWGDQTGDSKSKQEKPPSVPPPEKSRTKALTFSACYLGSYPVAESELVPGQCVKVVHSCVKKMTSRRGSRRKSSNADKGRVVFLQIQGMDFKWLEPETSAPITVQPINRIRVWGIGLENERDFGYVARDPATRKHKCHVFRCDMPARAVARALLETHHKEKGKFRDSYSALTASESSTASSSTMSVESRVYSSSPDSSDAVTESTELMIGRRSPLNASPSGGAVRGGPERYTRITCVYIGSCDVRKAVGMDVLNGAVEKLSTPAKQAHWIDVHVDIATSHIKVTDIKTDRVIREHRVRFLCFLGIGKDDRYCGYVIDSGEKGGEKRFQFHGFRKEPNTDRLCLCLHSACQARYQRVVDANPEAAKKKEEDSKEKQFQERGRSRSNISLLDKIGSFRKTKKEEDSKSQSFVVQYLGSRPVSKKEGVDTVKEPVQQLSILQSGPTHSSIPHLVEFEVSPSGLSITDPQKRFFARKNFSVKNITYVVRIRNYFAFIVRESGKYNCHVFLESEVDAGTVVTTIQNFLAPDNSKQPSKQQKK